MVVLACILYLICLLLSLAGFCKLAKDKFGVLSEGDVAFMLMLSLCGPLSLLVCLTAYVLEKDFNFKYTLMTKLTILINEKL